MPRVRVCSQYASRLSAMLQSHGTLLAMAGRSPVHAQAVRKPKPDMSKKDDTEAMTSSVTMNCSTHTGPAACVPSPCTWLHCKEASAIALCGQLMHTTIAGEHACIYERMSRQRRAPRARKPQRVRAPLRIAAFYRYCCCRCCYCCHHWP